jgi:hypothetical protein
MPDHDGLYSILFLNFDDNLGKEQPRIAYVRMKPIWLASVVMVEWVWGSPAKLEVDFSLCLNPKLQTLNPKP